MEIFKIVRQGEGKQVDVADVQPEQVKPDPYQEVSAESTELKQAKAVAGEVGANTQTAPGEVVEGKAPEFTLDATEKKNVVVKVDGPLSQVFTEALNRVLAFENMVLLPILAEELEVMKEEDESFNDLTSIHVQAYDANDLTTMDVVDITNEITKTVQDDHILVMESARGLSNAVGSVDRMCTALKTKSYYRFSVAANQIAMIAKGVGA